MTDSLSNPHDKFFRAYFGRPDVARDFVQTYLPADIVALLDLPSLDIRKGSFIDESLREHFSDLLYQVNLQDGRPTYLYLLFDHKSYVDRLVSWQLFKYLYHIWETTLQEQQVTRQKQPQGQKTPLWFAPILPLIVYHGQEKWTVSREFIDLFGDVPEPLRPYLPNFQYWLWDLSDYPPDAIQGDVLLRVAALLLKYVYDDELEERLPEILSLLRELADKPTVLGHLQTIMRYLSGGKEPFDTAKLQDVVDHLFEGGGTMQKTFIQKILDRNEQAYQEGLSKGERIGLNKGEQIGLTKGEQIGLNKGRQEGLTEGLAEGQRQTHIRNIQQTLSIRFALPMDKYASQLTELSVSQLETLNREALLVGQVAEFESQLQQMQTD